MVSLAPPSASGAMVEGDIAATPVSQSSACWRQVVLLWRLFGPQPCAGSTATSARCQEKWGSSVGSPAAAGFCAGKHHFL